MKLTSKHSALHARAELIIPWLVNGSLPDDAEPVLREHIASCPECRQDYAEQLRMRGSMRTDSPLVFAAELSYQKLLARIQNPEADREPRSEAVESRTARLAGQWRQIPPVARWLAAAVVLQAFALGAGAWAWHSGDAARNANYRTLTSASASYDSGPRVRVLFRPDLSVGTLQSVLQSVGAHIIDGPADGNVYTLGFAQPPGSRTALEQRAAALRAEPGVLFAEPVQHGVR